MGFRKFIVDLMPGFFVRFFAKPYVGGYSLQKALIKADKLWKDDHIKTTLDLLGESVSTQEKVNENIQIYMDVIENLKTRNEYISISIKLTAFGVLFDEELAFKTIEKILQAAHENQIKVTLDMEEHIYTSMTLQLYEKLLLKYPGFGTVLQSRLFRTKEDIEHLHSLSERSRIRMCIGIYNEPNDIALQKKPDMKVKLYEYAQNLVENGHFTEYATHDKEFIDKFLALAVERDFPKERVEFQNLLGVPLIKYQRKIVAAGFDVRLYLPFVIHKKDATAYLKRRMLNNPNMVFYVLKNMLRLN